jgi:hypothetical protein
MRHLLLIGTACLWAAIVPAAETVIEWPRPGYPAVVVPGGILEVAAQAEGALSLEGAASPVPLDVTWTHGAGGTRLGRAVVPKGTAPGRYAVQINDAAITGRHAGAVYVLEAFPEDYAIAVVRSAEADDPNATSPAFPADLSARLSADSAHLAVMLGTLTRNGSEEEYQALKAILETSDVPVYLCPDATEARRAAFRKHFGDRIHGVAFGNDGYLLLGPGLAAADSQTHARLGEAHRLRRALRASRWSVGVAGAYGLDWDLRAQIALFVDDPLNFLIVGSAPKELGATLPWGKTQFVLPADATPAALAIFEVTATGIRPRPQPEAAAEPIEAQALAAE